MKRPCCTIAQEELTDHPVNVVGYTHPWKHLGRLKRRIGGAGVTAHDEFAWEKILRGSDLRSQKLEELEDKYRGTPGGDMHILRERAGRGWPRRSQPPAPRSLPFAPTCWRLMEEQRRRVVDRCHGGLTQGIRTFILACRGLLAAYDQRGEAGFRRRGLRNSNKGESIA